jgi:predicted transcriptional regulator
LVVKNVDKNVFKSDDTSMAATTVRISPKGHALLRRLATASEASMSDVLDQALETYRRQKFLDEAGEAYDALRRDPRAWKMHQADISAWDATLSDGLHRR